MSGQASPRLCRRIVAAAVMLGVSVVSTGCYHSIINTDLTPGPVVHHESFKPAFIAGLVPAQVDGSKYCGGKRWARVETQHSFLNWVVGFVTLGIFTPMDIRVYCAAQGSAQLKGPSESGATLAADWLSLSQSSAVKEADEEEGGRP